MVFVDTPKNLKEKNWKMTLSEKCQMIVEKLAAHYFVRCKTDYSRVKLEAVSSLCVILIDQLV